MPGTDVEGLFAAAMSARRRRDWPTARGALSRLLEAAREAASPGEAWLAEGHLAVLDGDRRRAEALLAQVADRLPTDDRTAGLGMLIAEQWPAGPRDCETHLVARAKTYRALCRSLPRPQETALELGAAHGLATRRLGEVCATVYAVEKSPAMAAKAREATAHLPNVRVIVASADDPGFVRAHVPRADVLGVDIGGSTPLVKVMHVARVYRELFQPRVLIIRSVYLNNFVAGLASSEPTYGPSIWTRLP